MEHAEGVATESPAGAEADLSEEEIFRRKWDVLVVGGGVIGMWSALHLARSGVRVLLVDGAAGDPGECSLASAGLLVPSRCKPLPGPGGIREGLSGLFSRQGSSLSLGPAPDPGLWHWLARFALSCRRSRFEAGRRVLREMGRRSLELLEAELAGLEEEHPFAEKGVLYPYYQRGPWIRAVHEARTARGREAEPIVLSAGEAREAEPGLDPAVLGAVLQDRDRRAEPERLLQQLAEALQGEGVPAPVRTRIYALDTGPGGEVERVRTTRGSLRAEQVLLAAGAGTKGILKTLGAELPLRSGTGWSVSFAEAENAPQRAMLLEEARVAVAPWRDGFRVTGGLELSGGSEIRRDRLQRVLRLARAYVPGLDTSARPCIRQGARPLTPDGLPLLGRVPGSGNLWVAVGHANLGLTLGAASGELMAAAMGGDSGMIDGALSPERFLGE